MLTGENVEEKIEDWQHHPDRLLAFMLEQIWKANIKPTDALMWRTSDGLIELTNRVGLPSPAKYLADKEVQTRSEKNGLAFYKTWDEAFKAAEKDKTIWKISWGDENNRVRMVRVGNAWKYEPIELPVPEEKNRK